VGVNQRAQITMTDDEIEEFVRSSRTMTLASVGPTGHPHLVAMWYGLVDGAPCFETKAKSQKVQNLRRDPRISCLVEDGDVYEELRGVALEGTAEVIEDAAFLWQVGLSVYERYYGPYTDEAKPIVEFMLNKRVAVRVNVERIRSWDHRKLGLGSTGGPGGSTAPATRRPRH
jgi:PPOX class probable F420-dependent enzyme